MDIRSIASQWRQAAWYDDPPPAVGYHATSLSAARSIEREGFRENPFGTYFASSPEDALKFLSLRIMTGMIPGGAIGVVAFNTRGLDIIEGTDHSPGFFGADTTSWATHDKVGPERIYGVETYQYEASLSPSAHERTAAAKVVRLRWSYLDKPWSAVHSVRNDQGQPAQQLARSQPRALCGAAVPDPRVAEVQVDPEEGRPCGRCENLRKPRTAAKTMPAKFPGKCVDCGKAIAKGETMVYDGKVHCTDCKSGTPKRRSQPMFDCPMHGRVPDEGWHEDCIRDWRAERGYR